MRLPAAAATTLAFCLALPALHAATPAAAPAAPAPAGAATPAPAGRTLVVAADGSGAYKQVQAALTAAAAGDVVVVKPGTYREAITFKNGVTLRGSDAATCILEPVDGAAAVITAVDCATGSIESLTFDGHGKASNDAIGLGLELENKDAAVLVKEVTAGGPAAAAGIAVGERLVSVNGMALAGDEASVAYLAALGATPHEVVVQVAGAAGAAPRTVKVKAAKVATTGTWPDGVTLVNSSVVVRNLVVQGMGGVGIGIIGPRAKPRIADNQLRENPAGIAFSSRAAGVAEGNTCSKGEVGLWVNGAGTAPALNKNTSQNNQFGISYMEGGAGTATGNTCTGNALAGIMLAGPGTAPTVSRNTVSANAQIGILCAQGATGTLSENVCEKNRSGGITIKDPKTAPTATGNTCRGNQMGLVFNEGAAGTATNNLCEQNAICGIAVAGKDTAPTVKQNTCKANQQQGIMYAMGAGGTAEANVCDGNLQGGFAVAGATTKPTLRGNICRNNHGRGFSFGTGNTLTAAGNTDEDANPPAAPAK